MYVLMLKRLFAAPRSSIERKKGICCEWDKCMYEVNER